MKVIIAGSRSISEYSYVCHAIANAEIIGICLTEIVSGNANGIDKLGEKYGINNNIKIKRFPANWNKYGKSAGYIRNLEMAEYADAAIILWDNVSKGTKHMMNLCDKYKLLTYNITLKI